MSERLSEAEVRGVLLDIEGTTTPISFVHDVLFSYARAHAGNFLKTHSASEDVRADILLLREEQALDRSTDPKPPDSIEAYIDWLIVRDRKSTGLKSLQGKIWREGYLNGSLKSQVYADVPPALERWHTAGLNISIFSSGSVLAQQLLFAHTDAGDLTGFISNYFDTNVGGKAAADSYRRIAAEMNFPAHEIVFISDVVDELAAAKEAGMKTLLSLRPGNPPQASADAYQSTHSFSSL